MKLVSLDSSFTVEMAFKVLRVVALLILNLASDFVNNCLCFGFIIIVFFEAGFYTNYP